MVISAVGDREIGSAGEPGEVAGSVPGRSELLGRRLGVKRSEWVGDLVGYLRTAFSAESGGGRAVKCRGRV